MWTRRPRRIRSLRGSRHPGLRTETSGRVASRRRRTMSIWSGARRRRTRTARRRVKGRLRLCGYRTWRLYRRSRLMSLALCRRVRSLHLVRLLRILRPTRGRRLRLGSTSWTRIALLEALGQSRSENAHLLRIELFSWYTSRAYDFLFLLAVYLNSISALIYAD
jgi:hypothetical protein